MKRFLSSLMLALTVFQIAIAADKPAITFHTNIYEEYGETNAFTLVVGGTQSGYIDVDCGFGPVEYELQEATFDQTSQSVKGTIINCHVNQDGIVRIYCDDPARIEYFNGLGAFIRQIEFAYPEELVVLNLEHNELESLDLSRMTNLQALYVSDNPFNREPFNINVNMPYLQILEIGILENIDPEFNFHHFPSLVSVDALSTHGLRYADTSQCPNLVRLSIDNTSVSSVDVSNNPELRILNVSDTRVTELDLSCNPKMQQLFATHYSSMNSAHKLRSLELSQNTEMVYLFLSGNALTTLDCSGMSKLSELVASHNNLTSINLEGCDNLYNLDLTDNCLDFNTLPVNPGTWGSYLGQQRDMPMPRSVAAGEPYDLSERVVRSDSPTTAAVYSVSRENPGASTAVSTSAWKYEDGKVTFNKAISDSVYVEFSNSTFQGFTLRTARFKVKAADDYGKPSLAFSFNPVYLGQDSQITFGVGIDGASEQNPKRVHVDLGNGELQVYDVKAHNGEVTTITATKPSYGAVKVYTEEGDVVTDLTIENMYLSEVDVTRAEELRNLTLRGLELYDIDLRWNRCLQSLTLNGNHFSRGLDLKGANDWYGKNVLTHINLSDNELSSMEFNDISMLKHLDLSHNSLTDFNFKDAEALTYIDLSHNKLTELVLNYCCSLLEGHFDHNAITSVRMPEVNIVERFTIDNNNLTLATLPLHGNIAEADYIYAPQADIAIPVKGPGHDLSSQYVEIDGMTTVYTWKTTDGQTLVEGTDYTINNGVTSFASSTVGKDLYCEISHPAFPAFNGSNALKTTVINSAGMPTNCLAKFVTPVGGQSVRLSMTASRPATAIYIDWTGKGHLTQYIITNETYTLFDAETTAGAEVKVYSYSNVSNLTVFSVTGATMESIDASGMKQLTMFAINGAGLTDDKIVYPRQSGLRDISLVDNKLTTFDFSPFTNLTGCSLDGNNIKSLDVSKASSSLEMLTVSKNGLEEITFGHNSNLWGLSLSGNKLTEVDFHGVPALYQLFLENNQLSSIDLSYLSQLRVVYLSGNKFDFNTLPAPNPAWTVYNYGNQAEIAIEDGETVDLSYLAERDGYVTAYTWYKDVPTYDPGEGVISGEALVEGDDYTIDNGCTTFYKDIDRVSCVLLNPLFPNMYMITSPITAKRHVGVDAVGSDATAWSVITVGRDVIVNGLEPGAKVTLVGADGRITASAIATGSQLTLTTPNAGFYVVVVDDKGSTKVITR